jgi:CheY-like chemotaxis protein
MRILLVDDSEDTRAFMSLALEGRGPELVEAEDAGTAYDIARAGRIDLVVTDLMMNGPTGLELITKLRSELPPPAPPIIACSGVWELESEALRRGAAVFLAKPFLAADLVAIIDDVARGSTDARVGSEAQGRSRWLRRQLVAIAAAQLGSAREPISELTTRADWIVEWIGRYFGFGQAAVLFLREGELRVVSASDRAQLAPGGVAGEGFRVARDVMESGATVLFGDVSVYLPPVPTDPAPIRFFAGVPLFAPGRVAVGALCFFDTSPRRLDAEDVAILEHLGRIGTRAIFSAVERRSWPHFFAAPMTLSRGGFQVMLGHELARAKIRPLTIDVAIANLGQALPPAAFRETVASALRPERAAVASFAPDRVAIYASRTDPDAGWREISSVVAALRGVTGVRRAGLVSIDGSVVSHINGHDLVAIACKLARGDANGWHGDLDRVVIRRAASH